MVRVVIEGTNSALEPSVTEGNYASSNKKRDPACSYDSAGNSPLPLLKLLSLGREQNRHACRQAEAGEVSNMHSNVHGCVEKRKGRKLFFCTFNTRNKAANCALFNLQILLSSRVGVRIRQRNSSRIWRKNSEFHRVGKSGYVTFRFP